MKVVIFVVTYNRLSTLRRSLDAYSKFSTPHEIVIINNDTDDPSALEYLNSLPYKIYNFPKIFNVDQLEYNIAAGVKKYYENNFAPYYAVSDCDICFEGVPDNTLDRYIELYHALSGRFNIGPALMIDQIPNCYPLKNKAVIDSAFDLLPRNQKNWNGIQYNEVQIDTTFCLFSATNTTFKRLSNTVRVNKPYAAHHLDWYIDIQNPLEDQIKYMFKKSPIGSSGGTFISGIYEDLQKSPEYAFQKRIIEWSNRELFSYYVEPYNLAWLLQFGIGCEKNVNESKKWIEKMIKTYGIHKVDKIPNHTYFEMIYDNNFTCLK
jgi:glycosyltransferase involved in cell wall biosynthesis